MPARPGADRIVEQLLIPVGRPQRRILDRDLGDGRRLIFERFVLADQIADDLAGARSAAAGVFSAQPPLQRRPGVHDAVHQLRLVADGFLAGLGRGDEIGFVCHRKRRGAHANACIAIARQAPGLPRNIGLMHGPLIAIILANSIISLAFFGASVTAPLGCEASATAPATCLSMRRSISSMRASDMSTSARWFACPRRCARPGARGCRRAPAPDRSPRPPLKSGAGRS